MLESTAHAVVRASVDTKQTDTLLRILNQPLQVIPRDFCYKNKIFSSGQKSISQLFFFYQNPFFAISKWPKINLF